MWCNRYNKECEEALKFNCNIPSDNDNIDTSDEYIECINCLFVEEDK